MARIEIPKSEFNERVNRLKQLMDQQGIDVCFVYGDEYRKENLRYISNFWPIFERGAAVIAKDREPIVLAAPEGELVCKEMSAWPDIRLVPDFMCVTVTDDIEYPYASYTDFRSVFRSLAPFRKIAIAGLDAMSHDVLLAIRNNLPEGAEVIDGNDLLMELRKRKSDNEIACLKEAARIGDAAYKALMTAAKVGRTENDLAAAAHEAAYREGAEFVPFCLVSSGHRVNTIIGRATNKVIEDGDMVMAALAVQYQGYVTTINFPFVVGKMSSEQKAFIDLLVEAEEIALSHLKAGNVQGELVKAVKRYFAEHHVSQYDLYPPMHGCGVAEAESPYPNESTTSVFTAGMTVNTDVSLFGHPAGSNRVEESLLVTEDGYESMSPFVRSLSAEWRKHGKLSILES